MSRSVRWQRAAVIFRELEAVRKLERMGDGRGTLRYFGGILDFLG